MTLSQLEPGTRFRIVELPEAGTAVLLKVNDCRALIRRDRPPEYVHYTTATGREVEFYRTAEPQSVTPYLNVQPVR